MCVGPGPEGSTVPSMSDDNVVRGKVELEIILYRIWRSRVK